MSKYDKERERLGLRPVIDTSIDTESTTRTTGSKYAREREALFNPRSEEPAQVNAIEQFRRSTGIEPQLLTPQRMVDALRKGETAEAPVKTEKQESKPGRNLPLIGPILRGLDVIAQSSPIRAIAEYTAPDAPFIRDGQIVPGTNVRRQFLEDIGAEPSTGVSRVIGQVVAPFAVPGAGLGAGTSIYRSAGGVIDQLAPRIAGNRIAREAAREAAVGGAIGAGIELSQGSGDLSDAAIQGAIGGALGAGLGGVIAAASPAVRRGLEAILSRRRSPQEPMLALPAPRPAALREGPLPPGTEPIPATGEVTTLALPEPELLPPTRARRVIRANPYREKFERLVEVANQTPMRPGFERETVEQLWARMAEPTDPGLDELIELAYPSRPNRITPDLVQRARETQRLREVYGVGMPVRSLSDRYQGGVVATAAMPEERIQVLSSAASQQANRANRLQSAVNRINTMRSAKKAVEPPTTRPIETPSVNREAPPVPNERGLMRTLRQSGKLSEPVQSALERSPVRTYEPITNVGTVQQAIQRISRGVDEAESFALGGKGALSAEQVATGFRLIDEFQRTGQTDRAITMAEQLAKRLTEAGQAVQAASIWNRLSPEGALVAAQRRVREINQNLPKGAAEVVIDEKTADNIMNAAAAIQRTGASRERAAQVMDIADRIRAGQAVSDEERQVVKEFVKDLQQFVKPQKQRQPRPARPPREMSDVRIRDRVVSFLDEQERLARERLRARGIQISSNPLDVYADYAIIGASKLARGTIKFADWSAEMIREFGEQVRPYLYDIYERAQDVLNTNTKRITQQTVSQAERVAERFLTKNAENLTAEDVDFIRRVARNVSELSGEAQKEASQELQAILNGFERAGIGRNISTVQYIAMLFNPVTQIRNALGNELMYRLERLMRFMATPVDMVVSKVTGKPREITFKKGPSYWENFFAPTKDYLRGLVLGAQAGWRGVNPEGLTTAYDISGQAFRSKLNQLTYLEKTLGAVMKGFDYAAYNRAVNQRLREMAYLDALNRGIQGRDNIRRHMDRYMANLDDNLAAIAKEYGRYVTLQDNTALSRLLTQGRRALNFGKEFGVGSLILPFAKTPANLFMRAMEYSPAGFLRTSYQLGELLLRRNTDLTRADIIQGVTRALFGTGMTGLGWYLAEIGVLRGESARDKDVRELEKQAGLGQYQVNASALQRVLGALITGNLNDAIAAAQLRPGDVLYQYEWAQPFAIPFAAGANVFQGQREAERAVAKGEQPQSRIEQIGSAAAGAGNTLLQTSVLRNLQEAFNIPPGEDNWLKAIGTNIASDIPSMFVPSIVGRVNQFLDENRRETYDPSKLQEALNRAKAKIPGLAQNLPQKVDTLGRPQKQLNTFFDAFINPATRSKFEPTKEAKTVIDLLNATGDEQVAPRAVPKYITGKDPKTGQTKRVDLTTQQFVRYQTLVGQEVANRIARLNPNASNESKIRYVIKILDEAGKRGREQMKRELGLR